MDKKTENAYRVRAADFAANHEQAQVPELHALLCRWFQPGMGILEIGGGAGRDSAFLRERGVDVWLSDGSEAMLAEAVQRHPELRRRTIHAAFPLPDDHPLLARRFDGIAALAVLMHIPDDELPRFAAQLPRLLRPGGLLILSSSRNRTGLTGNRDASGRLFRERVPGAVRRVFEQSGFRLLEELETPDSRARSITWDTLVLRLSHTDGCDG